MTEEMYGTVRVCGANGFGEKAEAMLKTCASAKELNRGTNNKHRGLMSISRLL
jgi:hypothetical protein